jgi:hypothetical protein
VGHFAGKKEVSMRNGAGPTLEETVASLFQSDTLAHDEYFDVFRRKAYLNPEKKLMLAVFDDAISCFQNYTYAQDKKRGALFREAEDWILEQNDDLFFSFESVCETLGYNPGYIRQRLLRWKEMKLKGRPSPEICLTARGDGWSLCG